MEFFSSSAPSRVVKGHFRQVCFLGGGCCNPSFPPKHASVAVVYSPCGHGVLDVHL